MKSSELLSPEHSPADPYMGQPDEYNKKVAVKKSSMSFFTATFFFHTRRKPRLLLCTDVVAELSLQRQPEHP